MDYSVIHTAIDNLAYLTGCKTDWEDAENRMIDGNMILWLDSKRLKFPAEVKSHIRKGQLPRLLEQKQKLGTFIVITGKISAKLAKELQELKINYLDSGGNAFIKEGTLFFLIEGKNTSKVIERKHLFTPASVKLIFNFLIKPELVKKTYREISNFADVSLDTISKTIHAMRENGYLSEVKKDQFRLVNTDELVERWISEYGERVKPKQFMGSFRMLEEQRWEKIQLDTRRSQWSGEPAVDKLMNILRPAVFTLYSSESKQELIKNYKLIPDRNGSVKVYKPFWPIQKLPASETVPELLIYADLLLSDSARNIEVAKELMHEKGETILQAV